MRLAQVQLELEEAGQNRRLSGRVEGGANMESPAPHQQQIAFTGRDTIRVFCYLHQITWRGRGGGRGVGPVGAQDYDYAMRI